MDAQNSEAKSIVLKKKMIFFNTIDYNAMDVLPRDIKQYEIITRLDCISKMVLRAVLLGQANGRPAKEGYKLWFGIYEKFLESFRQN